MANLLQTIYRLINDPQLWINADNFGVNRILAAGRGLEDHIKDLFANVNSEMTNQQRTEAYNREFSFFNSPRNPPDLILQGGDAIEIKKISSPNANIHLSSSFPRAKLLANDPMITRQCVNCEAEPWVEKDLIYIVGYVVLNRIRHLWLFYGDCFAANNDLYTQVINSITARRNGNQLPIARDLGRVEFGHFNAVDPRGITKLRIRGLWSIPNPSIIFNSLHDEINIDPETNFQLTVIMKDQKFNQFPVFDRNSLLNHEAEFYTISDVDVPDPDILLETIECKLITFRN